MKQGRERYPISFLAILIAVGGFAICAVEAQAATIPFTDDFEPAPEPGWSTTGLWHLTQDGVDPCGNSHSATRSYGYHRDATCNFNTGAANSGALTFSSLDLTTAASAQLSFWSWYETEDSTFGDFKKIQVSTDGTLYNDVLTLTHRQGEWVYLEVDLSAYIGNPAVRLRFFFDSVDGAQNNGRGWYIDDVKVDLRVSDTLTVSPMDTAPAAVVRGANAICTQPPGVQPYCYPMMDLMLMVNTNAANIETLRIDLSGTGVNGDVFSAQLVHDANDNGVFDGTFFGDEELSAGVFVGKTLTFNITGGFQVIAGITERLFVVYSISSSAINGNTVGVSIAAPGYFKLSGTDTVSGPFPMQSTNSVIEATIDTLTVNSQNRAPATAAQGAMNVPMESLTLTVDNNSATVKSIRVARTGTGSDSDIVTVRLINDTNANGTYEKGADTILASAGLAGGTATVIPKGGFLVQSGTPEHLLLAYDVSPAAVVGNTEGLLVNSNASIVLVGIDVVSNANFPVQSVNSLINAGVPPTILSQWATVTPAIDGAYGAGEWTDARKEDLDRVVGNTLPSFLLVKNNATHLFLCYDAVGDAVSDGFDSSIIAFDTRDDGVATNNDEDQFVIDNGLPARTAHDLFSGGTWITEDSPFNPGLPNHTGLAGGSGFGSSPDSGTNHRIYE